MTDSSNAAVSPGTRGVEADMGTLVAYEPPPLVPEKAQEKWADYLHRTGNAEDSPISNGLKWYLAGYPIREAAGMADCKKSTLFDVASRYGLRVFHENLKDIIGDWKDVTKASIFELRSRLRDNPGAIKDRDLIICAGVGTDKAIAHEKSRDEGSGAFLESLAVIAERSQVTVKVEVSPVERPEPEVIEVNPA